MPVGNDNGRVNDFRQCGNPAEYLRKIDLRLA
jgi:hypothetical protein